MENVNDRFEIRLTNLNQEPVSLNAMSADALQSFMDVVSSLKSIAENVVGTEGLSFSIQEGSALCCVEAPAAKLGAIYKEINTAIEGKSANKEVTDSLRRIQHQLKREHAGYQFLYHQSYTVINVSGRLIAAKKIALKNRSNDHRIKLRLNSGIIKQIGGENPNYHLDCGNGDKRTIACSVKDAVHVNQFLYQRANPLVLCKEFGSPTKNDEFIHLTLIADELTEAIREFVEIYNSNDELVARLSKTHDYVDDQFKKPNLGHKIIQALLLGFNDKRFHLSEIKTLLVISKPFIEHDLIRGPRAAMLETYNAKRA